MRKRYSQHISPTTHYVPVTSCRVQLPALNSQSEYNQMHVSLRCKNNCCQTPTDYFNILYRLTATCFGLYARLSSVRKGTKLKSVCITLDAFVLDLNCTDITAICKKGNLYIFHYIISASIDIGQLCKALDVPVQSSS